MTVWVATGEGAALVDGEGAADEGAADEGAADEGAADEGAADEGGRAAEEVGCAADGVDEATDEGAGAEDVVGAELADAADGVDGAADEGVLGAAEDSATEEVDGSGAAEEGAGEAADGVTLDAGAEDAATEGGVEEEEEEGAANDRVGAEEGETREMNVLAAVLFADDILTIARHAGGQAGKSNKRRRQRQRQNYVAETHRVCEVKMYVSVSRVPAGLVSWFVPMFLCKLAG